jgi:DNA (cytosine-5)-methyltransferase 1
MLSLAAPPRPFPSSISPVIMEACGLFAGIGGLELGLRQHGVHTRAICEIDPHAQLVLKEAFPELPDEARSLDILDLRSLPECQVVSAGFPCQDLSMAGNKVGITGQRSGLVTTLFSLLERASRGAPSSRARPPEWLLIENVPYMLHLDQGEAMRFLTSELERMGWSWAYRVVDARAFGVPQRRLRVILLASRDHDPRPLLFDQDVPPQFDDSTHIDDEHRGYGFYWTEGRRGLGWAVDGVPTIKGGSTIGIPSPPAIWDRPKDFIGLPDIRDLERLQGFVPGYTEPAMAGPGRNRGARHRLVGNAVCVPVAAWVARRLTSGTSGDHKNYGSPLSSGSRWPHAAWGSPSTPVHGVTVSTWPVAQPANPILSFLEFPLAPLSLRATQGYLNRLERATTIHIPPAFEAAVRRHLRRMEQQVSA